MTAARAEMFSILREVLHVLRDQNEKVSWHEFVEGAMDSSANAALEKVLYDPNAAAQYRRKLKLPELGQISPEVKSQCDNMTYHDLMQDPLGRFFYLSWVSVLRPAQGEFLLGVLRTKLARKPWTEKRALAKQLVDGFVSTVSAMWSTDSVEELITRAQGADSFKSRHLSRTSSVGSKSHGRRAGKATKANLAKELTAKASRRLLQSSPKVPSDLFDDMWDVAISGCDEMFIGWHSSSQFSSYVQIVAMTQQSTTVSEDDFFSFRVLGVGGFGSVKAAIKQDTGQVYAIKAMNKRLVKHKNRFKSCYTEVHVLKNVHSPFVCRLHSTFQTRIDVCLVLDLHEGGSLGFLLAEKKRIAESHMAFCAACVVQALDALHSAGFVYRDIKPANVVLKANGYCVLVDFGLAASVADSPLMGRCGTRGYWSPEMVKGDLYLTSGDWWSLGVMLVELISGRKPFKRKFQKHKQVDGKVQVVPMGNLDDDIEQKGINKKPGKAKEEEDDGRDSEEEESDDDDDDELKKAEEAVEAEDEAVETMARAARKNTASTPSKVSSGKQRDRRIYLTQEVWVRRELLSGDGLKLLQGLMSRDVNHRLGVSGGITKLRSEPFFARWKISWPDLDAQTLPPPFAPARKVNAKQESELKTLDTHGLGELTPEDDAMWDEWDWSSPARLREEMVDFKWAEYEKCLGSDRGKVGGAGCCTIM